MDLQDQGVIDSGFLRHMTGNMSYLIDYEEIDGGYVAFEGNPKGGKIIGKGTIKTGNLDFKNVYFVRELKFNLFSVSQMCDKNNSVLFNDTECIVLSPNFKLTDKSQVLLKVPGKNNIYSVDLKNIVPKGGLTCIFAKATSDESELWHRRLRHINFKTMNKLVKGNFVRGLPSKRFENNQTCVACQKESYHQSSYKSKSFDGKADEGFFVGYSINSKAFRVFNSRTRIVKRDTCMAHYDDEKKVDEDLRKDSESINQEKDDNVNSTNNVNAASTNEVNAVGGKTNELPDDPNMPALEDIDFEDPSSSKKLYKSPEKGNYMLHQAPKAWYETLSTYLLDNGLQRGKIDKTLFIRRDKGDILLVQVFTDVKTTSTPMENQKLLLKDENGKEVVVHLYRLMIGSLMYLTSLRHDIMFVACACVRYQVNPNVSHIHAVKRIFRYLKGEPKLGLWYPKDLPFDLVAYTDSEYAGASLDRKSTTGGCQFLGSRLISWQCKK
ncbi:putative ribonuclease H-like domain-containing protein [Tanacetum coccineum]